MNVLNATDLYTLKWLIFVCEFHLRKLFKSCRDDLFKNLLNVINDVNIFKIRNKLGCRCFHIGILIKC